MHSCHGNVTLSTLVKKSLNVLELSLKHGRNRKNLSCLTYITHLPIHIQFIVIMFGAIHILPISQKNPVMQKNLLEL